MEEIYNENRVYSKGTLFIDLRKIPVYSIMKPRKDGVVYERKDQSSICG